MCVASVGKQIVRQRKLRRPEWGRRSVLRAYREAPSANQTAPDGGHTTIQGPHNIHDNGLPIHRSIYIGCIYIFLPPGWLPMHPCTPFLKFRPEPGRAHSMHLMHALDPRWSLQRNSMHPMHPMHPSRPTRTCSPCTPCTPCTNPSHAPRAPHAPMHPCTPAWGACSPCTHARHAQRQV